VLAVQNLETDNKDTSYEMLHTYCVAVCLPLPMDVVWNLPTYCAIFAA